MNKTDRPCLALTFDDGPNSTVMPEIMDLLNRHGAGATFFLVGDKISDQTAPVLLEAVERGFELGNHGANHLHMSGLSRDQVLQEVAAVQEQVKRITGNAPVLFRPPYLDVSGQMLDLIPLPFVFGQGNNDWDEGCTVQQRIGSALKAAADGAVLLMHCFEGNRATVDALKVILPELQRQGFRIVSVSELFAGKGISLKPGVIYERAEKQEVGI